MKPEKSKKEVQLIHEDGSSVARSNGNSSIDSSSENFSGKTIKEQVREKLKEWRPNINWDSPLPDRAIDLTEQLVRKECEEVLLNEWQDEIRKDITTKKFVNKLQEKARADERIIQGNACDKRVILERADERNKMIEEIEKEIEKYGSFVKIETDPQKIAYLNGYIQSLRNLLENLKKEVKKE